MIDFQQVLRQPACCLIGYCFLEVYDFSCPCNYFYSLAWPLNFWLLNSKVFTCGVGSSLLLAEYIKLLHRIAATLWFSFPLKQLSLFSCD